MAGFFKSQNLESLSISLLLYPISETKNRDTTLLTSTKKSPQPLIFSPVAVKNMMRILIFLFICGISSSYSLQRTRLNVFSSVPLMLDNSQPHPPPQYIASNKPVGITEEMTVEVPLITSEPKRKQYFYKRPVPENLEVDDTKSYPCISERYRQGLDKKKNSQ